MKEVVWQGPRYAISSQFDSDTETNSSHRYSFIRFQFQINVLLNSMQILFTDMRQGTTNYKVQG